MISLKEYLVPDSEESNGFLRKWGFLIIICEVPPGHSIGNYHPELFPKISCKRGFSL
jgi:hypothetical protein